MFFRYSSIMYTISFYTSLSESYSLESLIGCQKNNQAYFNKSNLFWINGGWDFDHLLELHTTWEHHKVLYMECTNVQASLDYIKRLSLSCGRSISSWLTSVSSQPRPQPSSISLRTSCWLIGVISEEFISVLSPSGLIIHPENREDRRPSISASLHPSIYLSLLSPTENKHPPPPPCLIVHIVIGDISINLVICSWVSFVFSFLYFFLLHFFFSLSRFLLIRDFGQKTTVFFLFPEMICFSDVFFFFCLSSLSWFYVIWSCRLGNFMTQFVLSV